MDGKSVEAINGGVLMDTDMKWRRLRARVAQVVGLLMVAAAVVAVFSAAPAASDSQLAKVIGSSIGVDPDPADGER